VRPSGGGQYGPATGDVMRTWIDEGRIGADGLVWREGWRDWKQAAGVFPQLGAQGLASELGAIGGGTSAGPAAGAYRRPARTRSTNLKAVILAVLIFAVVVLLGVFLWLLSSGPGG
jgi:hypothetical protein